MEANLSDWRQKPGSEWAFQNVEQLIKVHTITKAPEKTSSLAEDKTKSLEDFKIQTSTSPELDLQSYLDFTDTDGFIVLHKGKVIYEQYSHGNDRNSKHIMFSMTKSVVGLIAGILVAQGKFDVHAPIKQYVPEASSIFDNITVQQCLDMQSGIKYEDTNPGYRAAVNWEPQPADLTYKTLHHFLQNVEAPTDGPGVFNYSSLNTDLAGWALERASGKKLSELITELLWQPMGAESDAQMTVDSEGSARAAGGMAATIRDIARIGQVLADGGRGIVPKEWIHDIVQGGDRGVFERGPFDPIFQAAQMHTVAYRNFFYTDADSKTTVMLGLHGQQTMVDLEHDIVVAKTSSQPIPIDGGKIAMNLVAFQELKRLLLSS